MPPATAPAPFPDFRSARGAGEGLALLGALVSLLGMLMANAVMSAGLGIWVLGALVHPDRMRFLARWRAEPALWGLSLLFFSYAVGGLYSADAGQFSSKLGVKLPFLLLPYAALALPVLDRRRMRWIWSMLVLAVLASSLVVLVLFAGEWRSQTHLYASGNAMTTPINHIRYSLLVAFSAAAAFWLWRYADGPRLQWRGWRPWRTVRGERTVWALAALFLIGFLHVLAVRSGLLALYLVLGYGFMRWALRGREWRRALPALALVLLAVVLAFRFVPTLQNRIRYARYDLERFAEGDVNPNLSDAKRIGSLHAGWLLLRAHPLLGVGTGDVDDALQPVYAEHYPDLVADQPLPHNQFLFTGAALGAVGLLALCTALLLPWLAPGMARQPLFVAHQLVLLSSMLTEATLETQYGTTLYLVPLLLLLRQRR